MDALQHDVIVIGAGPAGSASALLLARHGFRVLVLEQDQFPRFHIGESLLPRTVATLARWGIELPAHQVIRKSGAEFFSWDNLRHAEYPFADALPGGCDHAYQVERASFDLLLAEHAAAAGASLRFGQRVNDVVVSDDDVMVCTRDKRYRGRYCIDATGQSALLARRHGSVQPMTSFGRAAQYTHFAGGSSAAARSLQASGNILVLMHPEGWLWAIPLAGERISVGFVTRGTLHGDALDSALRGSEVLVELTRGAERGVTRRSGNFSFSNSESSGPRFACVGDAACFLDPVFSSGVALALESAERVAVQLAPALEQGREGDAHLVRPAGEAMAHAYASMGKLVHAFYHTEIVENLFFALYPDPQMRSGLISLLAADLWRDDNRFQQALEASRRRRTSPT